jgi:excisionase family DNA binding protein
MAKILTVRQAAELLQASEETVRDWLRRGRIPGRRVGRSWRISEDALLDWLGANGAGHNVLVECPERGRSAGVFESPEPAEELGEPCPFGKREGNAAKDVTP